MKILNLYAGIGGNRELWDGDITSVEIDSSIASVYEKRFPIDSIIVDDANKYLLENYNNFDFIWASPPCQSHGQYRHNVGVIGKGFNPLIPDMTNLYGLIVFLRTYFKGKWVVENTKPYYQPLIKPTIELQRHYFWSNFQIEDKNFPKSNIRNKNKISDFHESEHVIGSKISNKRQVLRNCVNPELGQHILSQAIA